MIKCPVCNWEVKDNEQFAEHIKYSSKCNISKGHKADSSKPDLSLIPMDSLWEMGKAFTYGANKYGRHNFREGIEMSRLLAASMRHITQFNEGEDIDEETQCLHLGNAMAGLAMAIFMYKNKPEMDNRWKKK